MASAGAIKAGSAFIRIWADDKEAQAAFRRTQARVERFADSAIKVGAGLSALGAAAAAPFASAVRTFMKAGDELDKMASRTGVAVASLSKLDFAAKQSGSSLAAVEGGIKAMQATIGNAAAGMSRAQQALARVGIAATELSGLTPEKQFDLLAAAVASIPDPAQRASAAIKVFGGSGTDLLPMMENLADLRAEAERLGVVMSSGQSKQAALLTDAFTRLGASVQTLSMAIGASLAPTLIAIADGVGRAATAFAAFAEANPTLVKVAAGAAVLALAVGGGILAIGGLIKAGSMAITHLRSFAETAKSAMDAVTGKTEADRRAAEALAESKNRLNAYNAAADQRDKADNAAAAQAEKLSAAETVLADTRRKMADATEHLKNTQLEANTAAGITEEIESRVAQAVAHRTAMQKALSEAAEKSVMADEACAAAKRKLQAATDELAASNQAFYNENENLDIFMQNIIATDEMKNARESLIDADYQTILKEAELKEATEASSQASNIAAKGTELLAVAKERLAQSNHALSSAERQVLKARSALEAAERNATKARERHHKATTAATAANFEFGVSERDVAEALERSAAASANARLRAGGSGGAKTGTGHAGIGGGTGKGSGAGTGGAASMTRTAGGISLISGAVAALSAVISSMAGDSAVGRVADMVAKIAGIGFAAAGAVTAVAGLSKLFAGLSSNMQDMIKSGGKVAAVIGVAVASYSAGKWIRHKIEGFDQKSIEGNASRWAKAVEDSSKTLYDAQFKVGERIRELRAHEATLGTDVFGMFRMGAVWGDSGELKRVNAEIDALEKEFESLRERAWEAQRAQAAALEARRVEANRQAVQSLAAAWEEVRKKLEAVQKARDDHARDKQFAADVESDPYAAKNQAAQRLEASRAAETGIQDRLESLEKRRKELEASGNAPETLEALETLHGEIASAMEDFEKGLAETEIWERYADQADDAIDRVRENLANLTEEARRLDVDIAKRRDDENFRRLTRSDRNAAAEEIAKAMDRIQGEWLETGQQVADLTARAEAGDMGAQRELAEVIERRQALGLERDKWEQRERDAASAGNELDSMQKRLDADARAKERSAMDENFNHLAKMSPAMAFETANEEWRTAAGEYEHMLEEFARMIREGNLEAARAMEDGLAKSKEDAEDAQRRAESVAGRDTLERTAGSFSARAVEAMSRGDGAQAQVRDEVKKSNEYLKKIAERQTMVMEVKE